MSTVSKIEYDRLLSFQLENQASYLEWVRTSVLLFGFGITILTFTEGQFWSAGIILLLAILFLIEGYISYIDFNQAIMSETYVPRNFIPINFWIVIILYIILMIVVYKDRYVLHPIG